MCWQIDAKFWSTRVPSGLRVQTNNEGDHIGQVTKFQELEKEKEKRHHAWSRVEDEGMHSFCPLGISFANILVLKIRCLWAGHSR